MKTLASKYINEQFTLTYGLVNSIKVIVPVYDGNFVSYYVCDTEIAEEYPQNFSTYVRTILDNFAHGVQKKVGGGKFYGTAMSYCVSSGKMSSNFAKPTVASMRRVAQFDMSDLIGEGAKLNSIDKMHVGAVYSSLLNHGFVLLDGKYAHFRGAYPKYLPFLKITNMAKLNDTI